MNDERPGIGMTVFAAIALGVLFGWASVFAIPPLERSGVPTNLATNVPFAAFAFGGVWGLALRFSERARSSLLVVSAPFLVGAAFWVFALLAGGLLVGVGVPPAIADYVPGAGFGLGFALGLVPLGSSVVERIRG